MEAARPHDRDSRGPGPHLLSRLQGRHRMATIRLLSLSGKVKEAFFSLVKTAFLFIYFWVAVCSVSGWRENIVGVSALDLDLISSN